MAKHAGGIAEAASAHLSADQHVDPCGGRGRERRDEHAGSDGNKRDHALDRASHVFLGGDEPRHPGKRDAPERREERDRHLNDPPGDAPEPKHGDPSEGGDRDVHALVAQHVQDADGLIRESRS